MKHYHYAKFFTTHNAYQKVPGCWTVTEAASVDDVCEMLRQKELEIYNNKSLHTCSTWEFLEPVGHVQKVNEHAAVVVASEDCYAWVVIEDEHNEEPEQILEQAFDKLNAVL